jgi:Nif-specific regulatory protein
MRAHLKIEAGDGRPGELDLDPQQPITMGRSRDNTIVLRSEHASRLHAKIYYENDAWYVRDFSMNGTLVNGARIHQAYALEDGHDIRIGEIRLRFTLPDPAPSQPTKPHVSEKSRERSTLVTAVSTTRLQTSDMSVLCTFMASHVGEADAHVLLQKSLQLLVNLTQAYVAGFLSPDANEPMPKVVIPDSAGIDVSLSRHLTRRVQRDGKPMWLSTEVNETRPTDLLQEVTDALCVPVGPVDLPLGMLHLYRKGEFFSERDLRFAEALADFLAGCMRGMHVRRHLEAEVARLRSHPPTVEELIGDSAPMVHLRQQIAQAALQPLPVLIHGEPGVGLETVAYSLHAQGPRSAGPFIAVPCLATAPTLLEGELFGTAAAGDASMGWCLAADEGTLFLDEVAALPLEAQTRLVHLIEDKSIRPVTSAQDIRADVRIVAATQYDLEDAVEQNLFRKPLFDRLNMALIEVPPLRAHLDDVPYLVQYFLDKLTLESQRQVSLSDSAMHKLQAYLWPGNARQLRAELEAAVLRSNNEVIEADELLVGCDRHLMTSAATS